MGSPAGASGPGFGASANVYTPKAQPVADQGFQNIANQFYQQYMSGQTPGQQYLPQINQSVSNLYNKIGRAHV